MIDLKELIKAGVHFGHQTSRWSPKMAPFIWGHRSDVHLIDVSKTARQMVEAGKFLEELAADGKPILWIGTKKAARGVVKNTATKLGYPSVTHRWIGGTLTNNSQVRKSITKLLHYEDVLDKSHKFPYTKKELNVFSKLVDRLDQNVGGIRDLKLPLGAIVIVDVKKEQAAMKEAAVIGLPIIALVDTNSDPTLVDYVIPANDDAPKSIELILNYLAEAVERGQKKAAEQKAKIAEERAAAAALKAKADKEKAADKAAAKAATKKEAAPAKKAETVKTADKKAAAPEQADVKAVDAKKPAAKAEKK